MNKLKQRADDMNDLFEIVEDLEAVDAKMVRLQDIVNKWTARAEEAEQLLERQYQYEMDDGA